MKSALIFNLLRTVKRATATCRVPPLSCECRVEGTSVFSYRKNHNSTIKLPSTEAQGLRIVAEDADNNFREKLVSSLNFKKTPEALPFSKLPTKTLIHLSKVTQDDKQKGYCENRVYYIAQQLHMDPFKVSECIAKRTFIYTISFEWLKNSLDVLLEFGVSPDRILRDLWVLKYHHSTIRERLQKIRDMGVDVLCPWMVRCSEDILHRFITISQDTKSILGDKSTQIYLANRLNATPRVVEEMFNKLPALRTMRVTKLKNFLDFLIQEGFTIEEIRQKVRILTASQKTVEQRLEKLRKLGLKEINLNVLCRSRKQFRKYCSSVEKRSSSTSSDSIIETSNR